MENANSKKAYEFIRKKILDGIYAPGYRLQTVDLAESIGVSRTPVRDALRELESEGLVKILPRLGASVRSLTRTEFRELCELRLGLESLAAELAAANRSPDDIIELQDAIKVMDAAVKGLEQTPNSKPLIRDLIHYDFRFHFAVHKAAHNELVREEILRLHLLNRVVWMSMPKGLDKDAPADEDFRRRRVWIQETHRRIFLAIKAQDRDAARKTMHDHITEIIDLRIRAIDQIAKKRDLAAGVLQDAPYA